MNKERRKLLLELEDSCDKIGTLVLNLMCDEQDSFDEMIEDVQNSDEGAVAQKIIGLLHEAVTLLSDAAQAISDARLS